MTGRSELGTTPPAADAAAVRLAVENLTGTLLLVQALVEAGRRVDLKGLDRDVMTISAAAVMLAPAAAREVRPALIGLLRQVEKLQVSFPPP